MSEKQELRIRLADSNAEIARLKRIMKDISTRMNCTCDELDWDCMPCDRCALKDGGEDE
jgi:hypothetical protein